MVDGTADLDIWKITPYRCKKKQDNCLRRLYSVQCTVYTVQCVPTVDTVCGKYGTVR